MSESVGTQGLGPATDRNNEPVTDPTANVRELVDAAMLRQDDLRRADAKMRKQEGQHIRELMTLRAEFAKEIRQAESGRINAIRAVDVQAVQQAATVSTTQATTLAAQVATSADTLRIQVAAAATAWESRLLAALDPIQKDIQDLRKAQYEAQGQKTQVIETRSAAEDLKPFFDQLQALIVAQSANQGAQAQVAETRLGVGSVVGMVGGAVSILALIAAILIAILR